MDHAQQTSATLLLQYERALKATEASFHHMIEKNADGVLVLGQNGEICYANPAAEALLGCPAERLVGQQFGTPVVPGESTEVDILKPGQSTRVAELRAVAITWHGRAAYLASLRDITAHKRAEEAALFLAEASRILVGSLEYPTILDQVAQLAVPHLADWSLIHLAQEGPALKLVAVAHPDAAVAAALWGCEPETWSDPNGGDVIAQVWQSGRPKVFSVRLHDPAAPVKPEEFPPLFRRLGFRSFLCLPLIARGHSLGVLTLVDTNSDRLHEPADLPLAEAFAQRAAAAIENARLYHAVQEADRRKSEFLAMLSHELRNPMAAIRNALQIIGEPDADFTLCRQAQRVAQRQVRHISRLLDDLLDLSRLTRGKVQLQKQLVLLAEVVEAAVQTCRPFLTERAHHLEVALPPEAVWLEADPDRLEQVVANLLHNAAKYTDPGGQIRLAVECEGDAVVLRFRDTGIGIAPEQLSHVFDLFMQADTSPERARGGLGIGLTLVRSLVEMHGGSIRVASAGLGWGSEFVVRLPRVSIPPPAAPCPEALTPAHPSAPAPGRRVLIIEDHADGRDMLRGLLEFWGHQVAVAEDGPQGIAQARAGRPEVVLIDIGLPGLNGYEVARHLRDLPGGHNLLLIAMTGYGQAEDRRRARAAGFDIHLVKPVQLDQLEDILAGKLPANPRQTFSESE